MQRGRCTNCGVRIWAGHPIGEFTCLLIALLAVWAGSDPLETGLAALFGWALVFAALVDWRTYLLPDIITLPLIPIGIAAAFLRDGQYAALYAAIGALIGYAAFAGLAWLYRRLRGRDGLGLGDAKLLAAGGAWAGPLLLTWIVALGAGLTLAALLVARLTGGDRMQADTAAPFGPGLSAAAFLVHIAALAGIGPGALAI
jgi:leader peptidase (prepilin peptidase)/N-methyltransferase